MDDAAYQIGDKYRTLLMYMVFLVAGAGIVQAQTGAPPNDDPGDPDPIIASQPCPEYSERAETLLKNFLSLPVNTEWRENIGVDHLSKDQVSTVTDEEVCGYIIHELRNNVMIQGGIKSDGWTRHILQAGNYYFVEYLEIRDHSDGLYFSNARGPKHVFNQSFNVVYSWAHPDEH